MFYFFKLFKKRKKIKNFFNKNSFLLIYIMIDFYGEKDSFLENKFTIKVKKNLFIEHYIKK